VEGGEMKLKLYVWPEFEPDRENGIAFAIAKSKTEARKIIEKKYGNFDKWGTCNIYPLTLKIGFAVQGGGW
jgi:hypothetical protein